MGVCSSRCKVVEVGTDSLCMRDPVLIRLPSGDVISSECAIARRRARAKTPTYFWPSSVVAYALTALATNKRSPHRDATGVS